MNQNEPQPYDVPNRKELQRLLYRALEKMESSREDGDEQGAEEHRLDAMILFLLIADEKCKRAADANPDQLARFFLAQGEKAP